MFFLGQPVLPLRLFFFRFGSSGLRLLRNVRKDTALCQEASSWLVTLVGPREPPKQNIWLWENICYFYHPLSIWLHVYTLIFISIYIYIYTTLHVNPQNTGRDVILFQCLWKQHLERNKRCGLAVKRNVAAIEYIPSDLRHNGTWAWGYTIHRDEGQG